MFFAIYAPLTALGYVLCEATNVSIIGSCFRNMFPNLLQPQKVHAWSLVVLIPLFFILFYLIFKWAILKFDIKTRDVMDVKILHYILKQIIKQKKRGRSH